MIRDLSCPIGEFTGDKLEAETLHVSDGGGDGLVSNSDIAKEQGFGNARDKGRGHTGGFIKGKTASKLAQVQTKVQTKPTIN